MPFIEKVLPLHFRPRQVPRTDLFQVQFVLPLRPVGGKGCFAWFRLLFQLIPH